MPAYKPAVPGQPLAIAASDWNAAMAAARRSPPPSPLNLRASLTPGTAVLVRNDTGGDLPAFVPVRLGATVTGLAAAPDPLPYESRDRPLFEGLECDGGGVHVVTQEAIPEGEIGRAVVQGVTVARVASGLAAGDACQPPASGNVELVAGGSFAKVLTAPTGSGDRLALVLIGTGGGAGQVVVMATAPNDGQQWTTGLVQRFTSTGDLTAASPFEVVELKPLHESERLVSGQPYLCVDTGVRGSGGRRRLRAERLGGAGSPGGYVRVVTDVVCVGDDLVKTYTNIPVYS